MCYNKEDIEGNTKMRLQKTWSDIQKVIKIYRGQVMFPVLGNPTPIDYQSTINNLLQTYKRLSSQEKSFREKVQSLGNNAPQEMQVQLKRLHDDITQVLEQMGSVGEKKSKQNLIISLDCTIEDIPFNYTLAQATAQIYLRLKEENPELAGQWRKDLEAKGVSLIEEEGSWFFTMKED